jgi:hypothetical protein
MLTHELWLTKFPQFAGVPSTVFDAFKVEATIEMGEFPERWSGEPTYDIAMGYLIAHLSAMDESWSGGDHTTLQPLRSKEVDDVMVEYAVSRDMQNNFDPYLSTVYGQQYVKWRRMVFAGPRMAGNVADALIAEPTYPVRRYRQGG